MNDAQQVRGILVCLNCIALVARICVHSSSPRVGSKAKCFVKYFSTFDRGARRDAIGEFAVHIVRRARAIMTITRFRKTGGKISKYRREIRPVQTAISNIERLTKRLRKKMYNLGSKERGIINERAAPRRYSSK